MRILQLEIDTYTQIDNQTAVKFALDIISRLRERFTLKGDVEWSFNNDETIFDNPLRQFKWEKIVQSESRLDYLNVFMQATNASLEQCNLALGFFARTESNFPDHFSFTIGGEFLERNLKSDWQEYIVELGNKLFSSIKGVCGYITYEFTGITSKYDRESPYDRIVGHRAETYADNLEHLCRGYYWGNFLSKSHIELLGGIGKLQPHFYQITPLENESYYLQLTQDITQVETSDLETIRQLFAPILLKPNPESVALKNNYYLILDEPPELYKSASERQSEIDLYYQTLVEKNEAKLAELDEETITFLLSDEPEALAWLEKNPDPSPLASNRFDGKGEAIQFVKNLYDLGATNIYVAGAYKNMGIIIADSLNFELPTKEQNRKKILELVETEMRNEGIPEEDLAKLKDYQESTMGFWWD
ncbi:hypothetical protein [Candidatus Leptofilum sp.]|uniref:hypothetical protein n=1 Tax=Candidatus Leptofilum sp. TaxID=3241576 RepID=UPI003B59EBCA